MPTCTCGELLTPPRCSALDTLLCSLSLCLPSSPPLSLALFLFYSLVCWILHALILCSATKQATNFYNSHTKHTHSNPPPLSPPAYTHTPDPQVPLSLCPIFLHAVLSFVLPPKMHFQFLRKTIISASRAFRCHASTPPAPSLALIVLFLVRFAIWKLFFYLFCPVSPFFWQICSTIWTANYGNSQHTHRQKERERGTEGQKVCACVWELLI